VVLFLEKLLTRKVITGMGMDTGIITHSLLQYTDPTVRFIQSLILTEHKLADVIGHEIIMMPITNTSLAVIKNLGMEPV
jgi:hypothetical protein